MKQLKIVTVAFWFGVAGVVASFGGSLWYAMSEKKATEAIIEANPIPVPALPTN